MALTEKQLERRRESLGGSDIAVLMGHSRRSQYDLWLDKKHGVDSFTGNDATEFGHVVESAISHWAADELGCRIRKNVFRAHPTRPFHANLDAMVVGELDGERAAIEVKFTGFNVEDRWGEPGSDDVPHEVVTQTQWQIALGGLDTVHVAAGLTPSFGSNKLRLYKVDRHDGLIDVMQRVGEEWWETYVCGSEVPDDLPSEDSIKAIQRIPNFEVNVDRDLLERLNAANLKAKEARAMVRDLKSQVHAALYCPEKQQFAEVGVVDGCDSKVTFFEHHRKAETKPRAGGSFRKLVLPKGL